MSSFIIKHYRLIIAGSILTGLFFGALIPFSRTDPEIRNYIPLKMSSRLATDTIENVFGVQDLIVIAFSDTDILRPDDLKQIKAIDRGLSRLSGISNRISPFTVSSIKGSDGMMTVDPLIRRIPEDSAGIRQLGRDILNDRFAKGIVFSTDLTTAAITATINKSKPEVAILDRVDSVIAVNPGRTKILTGGLPYIRQHIMTDVKRDAVVLVPLALLIMLLVLKFSLRRWRNVFLPFTVVLLSVAISMGMIPLAGWRFSIITLLVPVILIAVANNYGIYLVTRSGEIRKNDPEIEREKLIRDLMSSLNMPILFSGLTTIAGLLGLLTHSIIPARQLGILSATGVTAALLMSLLLIPSFLYLRKPSREVRIAGEEHTEVFGKIIKFITGLVTKYPGRIIAISTLLTIIFCFGMIFLKIETNQEKYFPRNNPVRIASRVINEKFGGSQTISVMVSGDIKDPDVLGGIDKMTKEVEKIKGVGQVFSISSVVREMSKAIYYSGEEGYDRIPDTREGIAQMFELYYMSGDPDDFSQIMSPDYSRAHILIKLSNPENKVIKSVKQEIDSFRGTFNAEITTGGYAIIMADFARSIIKGQVFSLLLALITVIILLAVIFRSLREGLTGAIPLVISILILFGFMGYSGIALDAATALLSSIMIGVGVDFTIQFLCSFKSFVRQGLSIEESVKASLTSIGRSIVINAMSVMAGFSVLVFSGFASIRFFGYLVIISISSCLIGALVLIPAILIKFKLSFNNK